MPCPAPWPRSTTILVESAEHGRVLADRLPRWKLLHALHGKPGPVYEKPPSRVHRIDRAIVTLVAADELDGFCPDVLIVAMGGDWAFELSNFKPASDQPTLLVDLLDDFDEMAQQGSLDRLQTYAARGWEIVAGSKWKELRAGQPCHSSRLAASETCSCEQNLPGNRLPRTRQRARRSCRKRRTVDQGTSS